MRDHSYTTQSTYTLNLRRTPAEIARERINLATSTPVLWFAMVTLDTLRALHEHDHKLAAYCATCERWARTGPGAAITEGRGDYCFVGRKPRCSYCRGQANGNFARQR